MVHVLAQQRERYLRTPRLCRDAHGIVLSVQAWDFEREVELHFRLQQDGTLSPEPFDRIPEDERIVSIFDIEDFAHAGDVLVRIDRENGHSRVFAQFAKAPEILLWQARGTACAPAITRDHADGAWVAFHHNVREDTGEPDLAKWITVLHFTRDHVISSIASRMTDLDRDREGEEQGFEFPTLVCGKDGALRIYGRGSHTYYAQDVNAHGWSSRVALRESSWGCRGRRVAALLLNDGRVLTARREREGIVVQVDAGPSGGQPALFRAEKWPHSALTLTEQARAREEANASFRARRDAFDDARRDGRHTLFGDIHQHSAHSDGCGSAVEPFIRARHIYDDDFCALSDHESFLGKRIGPGEWEYLQTVAEAHNEPERFATLFAYEWTGKAFPGPGHKVIYPRERGTKIISRDDVADGATLVESARKIGAIAVPHHVGWTGANEEAHDERVQPVWEICSCHGCYESFAHELGQRGDLRDQMVDAVLARGLKFGFIASSDGHGLLWHHGVARKRDPFRTGLAVVQAASCTRESILDALLARRCYATSGAKILVDFTADGSPMGTAFHARALRKFRAHVVGTASITSIELVGREGVLAKSSPDSPSGTLECALDADYVYVRVRQADCEMAWSSPIFAG